MYSSNKQNIFVNLKGEEPSKTKKTPTLGTKNHEFKSSCGARCYQDCWSVKKTVWSQTHQKKVEKTEIVKRWWCSCADLNKLIKKRDNKGLTTMEEKVLLDMAKRQGVCGNFAETGACYLRNCRWSHQWLTPTVGTDGWLDKKSERQARSELRWNKSLCSCCKANHLVVDHMKRFFGWNDGMKKVGGKSKSSDTMSVTSMSTSSGSMLSKTPSTLSSGWNNFTKLPNTYNSDMEAPKKTKETFPELKKSEPAVPHSKWVELKKRTTVTMWSKVIQRPSKKVSSKPKKAKKLAATKAKKLTATKSDLPKAEDYEAAGPLPELEDAAFDDTMEVSDASASDETVSSKAVKAEKRVAFDETSIAPPAPICPPTPRNPSTSRSLTTSIPAAPIEFVPTPIEFVPTPEPVYDPTPEPAPVVFAPTPEPAPMVSTPMPIAAPIVSARTTTPSMMEFMEAQMRMMQDNHAAQMEMMQRMLAKQQAEIMAMRNQYNNFNYQFN